MPGGRRWHKRGGIIKKLRNEEGVTKINRHHRCGEGEGAMYFFSPYGAYR